MDLSSRKNSMHLFVDTISDPCFICLFDEKRVTKNQHSWYGERKEFDTLIEEIDNLLKEANIAYKNLSGIICLVWPGSFTGTRVTTLTINTIAHSFGIPLYPLTVDEFLKLQNAQLPWILSITKREILLWSEPSSGILVEKTSLPEGKYSSLTNIDFDSDKYTIFLARDYEKVLQNLSLENPLYTLSPLYAKDPNITIKHD